MARSHRDRNDVRDTLKLRHEIDEQLHENVIKMNEIDKEIFHDLVDQYDSMADNLNAGLKEYAPFETLSEDIYQSLYKFNPQMREEEDVHAFSQLNHSMLDEIIQTEAYDDLRRSTKFDMLSSAIGTEVLQNTVMDKVKYYKEQYKQQQEQGKPMPGGDAGELIEQLNQAKGHQDKIDALMDKAGGDSSQLTKKQQEALANHQAELTKLEQEIEMNVTGHEQLQNGIKNAADEGTKKALLDVREVKDVVDAWGIDAATSGRRISYDNRKKAIERIRRSKRLHDLTDIIGRMRKIAMKKKKVKLPDGHSVENIENGNRIESVIPSEMMKLAHPVARKDFMMRFHEKKLLQYKKTEHKEIGRGPIVVAHDKSGSMQGEKDNWSTALCLAMLEVAQKEKRHYAYIPYNGAVIANHLKNIKAGELDPADILDIAELPSTGGTNFMAPLNEALVCIEAADYKKADICFITDGECHVSNEWLDTFLQKKKELNFYVNSIVINIGGGSSYGSVTRFSDNITTISSIAELDEANASKIFNLIDDKNKYDQVPATATGDI